MKKSVLVIIVKRVLRLDRRNLNVCPLLDGEEKLRLLNYQNNKIELISNLENLPQLIFLDFYNNNLQSLEGPLPSVTGENLVDSACDKNICYMIKYTDDPQKSVLVAKLNTHLYFPYL